MRAAAAVDRLLDPYAGAVPGAAVVVLRHGDIVLEAGRGLARLPAGPPVSPTTRFRLASITKQLTAKAVALLVDEGRLALDAPLRAAVPGLPAWGDVVRIGHLVAHTSGLPHYEALLPPDATAQVGDRDVARMMERVGALDFEPGTRFEYSNTGYVLLGVVIEEVAGVPFGAFLRERIFGPLGMDGAAAGADVAERALGYSAADPAAADPVAGSPSAGSSGAVGGFVDADQGPTTATLGDGGVYASVRELALWAAALREPGGVPDAGRLAPYAAPPPDADGYGWGWFLDRFQGRPRMRHEGWSTGFQNEVQRFPDTGLCVIMLTNRAAPPVQPIVESIVEVFDR